MSPAASRKQGRLCDSLGGLECGDARAVTDDTATHPESDKHGEQPGRPEVLDRLALDSTRVRSVVYARPLHPRRNRQTVSAASLAVRPSGSCGGDNSTRSSDATRGSAPSRSAAASQESTGSPAGEGALTPGAEHASTASRSSVAMIDPCRSSAGDFHGGIAASGSRRPSASRGSSSMKLGVAPRERIQSRCAAATAVA